MFPRRLRSVPMLVLLSLIPAPVGIAQASTTDQIQIAPPMRQMQSPPKDASAAELEKQGDELRSKKEYLDAKKNIWMRLTITRQRRRRPRKALP